MSRRLHILYYGLGTKIGKLTFLVDDIEVCRLAYHKSFDAEISNDKHVIRIKLGFLPLFKKEISAGENNWSLSFERNGTNAFNAMPGKWILSEVKPFYGKQINVVTNMKYLATIYQGKFDREYIAVDEDTNTPYHIGEDGGNMFGGHTTQVNWEYVVRLDELRFKGICESNWREYLE